MQWQTVIKSHWCLNNPTLGDGMMMIKLNNYTINTTDITACLPIQEATQNGMHQHQLKEYIIRHWPSSKNDGKQDMRQYQMFKDEVIMIDGIAMKVK